MTSLLRIVVILVVSTAAGTGWVRWQHPDLPWTERAEVVLEEQSAIHALRAELAIDLEDFLDRIRSGAVVIDARDRGSYEDEHLDISGISELGIPVLHVPPEEVVNDLVRLEFLRDQGYELVLYCNSDSCELSAELAQNLELIGFFRDMIRLYEPGWEGLEKAGLPTVGGADTWTGEQQGLIGLEEDLGIDVEDSATAEQPEKP